MEWLELQQAPEGACIDLKGFLFHAQDGRWILSTESGLKSCCVGSTHKKASQITLEGDFSNCKSRHAIKVTGMLHHAEEGLSLLNASATHQLSFPSWTLGFIMAAAIVYWAWKKVSKTTVKR